MPEVGAGHEWLSARPLFRGAVAGFLWPHCQGLHQLRPGDSSWIMSILVTGTGGGAGQSVLKSLQHTDYRVIAADGEVLGTGLYTTGKGYVIPYANSPVFWDERLEIDRI